MRSAHAPTSPRPASRRLWPVAANGFRDLNTRSRMQAEAVAQNANRLRELQVRGGWWRAKAMARAPCGRCACTLLTPAVYSAATRSALGGSVW